MTQTLCRDLRVLYFLSRQRGIHCSVLSTPKLIWKLDKGSGEWNGVLGTGAWSWQEMAPADKFPRQASSACQDPGRMDRTGTHVTCAKQRQLMHQREHPEVLMPQSWSYSCSFITCYIPGTMSQAHMVLTWCLECLHYIALVFNPQREPPSILK